MPTDGCPATGGISPGPLNGARREKELNTPTAGPRQENEGLEHPVHRPRAACRELRQSAAAALPLGPTSAVKPGLRGAPRFLGRETLEKPDNGAIVARIRVHRLDSPCKSHRAKCSVFFR